MRKRTRIEPSPTPVELNLPDIKKFGRNILHIVKIPIEFVSNTVDEMSMAMGFEQKAPDNQEDIADKTSS
jgi:hypothetical protein